MDIVLRMNTFLTNRDFATAARELDDKRLGKQRVECLQLLYALTGRSKRGWRHHPACVMWQRHGRTLAKYAVVVCDEWIIRGYRDSCREKALLFMNPAVEWDLMQEPGSSAPWWLGDERLHSAHRTALLCKAYERYLMSGDDRAWRHYSSLGWSEKPTASLSYEYWWPTEVRS